MDTSNLSGIAVPSTAAAELLATRDPFSGPIEHIAPWNFTILAVLMFAVTSLSLSENFCVMYVTFKYKQLRQPLNYIIVNLAIADFLVSLTGGVISFLTNARGYFFLGKWACVLEGFAVTFFGIVALWSLAVLSFERFFVICRPLGNIRLQAKHAILGLLFVWTFSFIWTFPPVLGWNRYTVSKIGTTCEPDWYTTSMINHSYIITFFTTCFILPLGVIFFCYGKLLRKLRKVSHGRLANAKKPERQVTRMVIVMIVAFMVGWTPYAVFSILVTAHPTVELDPRLASIPAFFSKTAAVYNPIIYVFMNKQFRKCLIQLFTGKGTIPDSNLNQTSERPGITAESHTGEMSAIAARIPMGDGASPGSGNSPTDCGSFAQLPIPENKVCPM
ncbi:vertebrate ancient long opsin a [Betta splendens]|uniref:Vertebrate ancient long opsin a n=1 Tax=Betta splendens TaxID=158456 RepID=A0A6P7KLS4_BETSP|nr:vertebrate ancient long opsin a [Betta splendens]